MSTSPEQPPKPPSRIAVAARLAGATLLALLLLAIALPSMKSRDSLPGVLAFTFTPLLLVYAGAAWSKPVEKAGWAILLLFLLLRLAG